MAGVAMRLTPRVPRKRRRSMSRPTAVNATGNMRGESSIWERTCPVIARPVVARGAVLRSERAAVRSRLRSVAIRPVDDVGQRASVQVGAQVVAEELDAPMLAH